MSPLSVPRAPQSASVPLRVLDAGDNLLQVQCIGGVHMAFRLDGNFAGTLINLGVRGMEVLNGGPMPCFGGHQRIMIVAVKAYHIAPVGGMSVLIACRWYATSQSKT